MLGLSADRNFTSTWRRVCCMPLTIPLEQASPLFETRQRCCTTWPAQHALKVGAGYSCGLLSDP
jgi:hypothetical protein